MSYGTQKYIQNALKYRWRVIIWLGKYWLVRQNHCCKYFRCFLHDAPGLQALFKPEHLTPMDHTSRQWCCQKITAYSSCCGCLWHNILLKNGSKHLNTADGRAQSYVLYSMGKEQVSGEHISLRQSGVMMNETKLSSNSVAILSRTTHGHLTTLTLWKWDVKFNQLFSSGSVRIKIHHSTLIKRV